jgi:integrase
MSFLNWTNSELSGLKVENTAGSLTITGDRDGTEAVYFKHADVKRIIATAREPYRTMFVLASMTGLRAGELLGLTVADIDFERLVICPRKQADDSHPRAPRTEDEKVSHSNSNHPTDSNNSAQLLRKWVEAKPAGTAVPQPQRSAV